jgi:hypothetical protein
MKPNVLIGQWRDVAFYRTTGNAKINNGSFADKSIGGKDHGAA